MAALWRWLHGLRAADWGAGSCRTVPQRRCRPARGTEGRTKRRAIRSVVVDSASTAHGAWKGLAGASSALSERGHAGGMHPVP